MEGFNPQSYRNNLATELKESRSESKGETGIAEAHIKLAEAQATEEYQVMKEVSTASKEAVKTFGKGNSFEEENKALDRAMEKFGFDVIDISDKIPKDVNLMIERAKLVGGGSEADSERLNEFMNEISEHKYLDPHFLNHVSRYDPDHFNKESEQQHYAEENYFGKQRSYMTTIDHGRNGFYFAAGKNPFLEVNKSLILFSNENPNFSAFLLSELLDHGRILDPKTVNYIQNESRDIKEIITVLKNDGIIQKFLDTETRIIDREGKKIRVVEDVGYHAENSPGVVAYLMLIGEPIELSNNQSGIKINGGYDLNEMIDSGMFKMNDGKFSFSTLADTIIDLPARKMYKFNRQKFENTAVADIS